MPKRDRNVTDHVYGLLKQQIVTMKLVPGQRLDDIALADEVSYSRTPIREALIRLTAEGLVTSGPRGGFATRALDLQDISQLFEAHFVIARTIARLVAIRATDEDLELLAEKTLAVETEVHSGDPLAISATNAELHQTEAVIARNEHLRGLAWSIHDQGQRLAYMSFRGVHAENAAALADHYAVTCDDHSASLAAFRNHDADAAETIAARHVRVFRDRIIDYLRIDDTSGVHLAKDTAAQTS